MSTPQRNDAWLIDIDPSLGQILRHQTLNVMIFNHHRFEELRTMSPEAQHALSMVYRDAFGVVDALGWRPDSEAATVGVRLTAGHIDQLRRCRHDLGLTIRDRLDRRDRLADPGALAEIDAEIRSDRLAVQGLDCLFRGGPGA